ncbi:hypothetical protein B296_00012475 [Ensete ventricosum]|uniref:Uncharacterized protein n=1 Tax=Ensete ventricosum TaxID=4639 RepID=A0A427A6F5_ENSVE|nr:hypothetical protein B296_00012475 [Ensete ventricosum]
MTTNTPSSMYKPLHEYRILRVSNSPHLCEFYITLSVVTQHVPLCTVSSLTKYPTYLEHYQVWLSTSSPEKATNHDGKHHSRGSPVAPWSFCLTTSSAPTAPHMGWRKGGGMSFPQRPSD